ncbi:hypothetical protein JTB14_019248 [Gonioctena quinquepunctata]|nr:hypothetical protein JTB14_019248 [Gonioctena quinquepunctata]
MQASTGYGTFNSGSPKQIDRVEVLEKVHSLTIILHIDINILGKGLFLFTQNSVRCKPLPKIRSRFSGMEFQLCYRDRI